MCIVFNTNRTVSTDNLVTSFAIDFERIVVFKAINWRLVCFFGHFQFVP